MSFLKMPLSGTISVADVNTVYVKPAGTQENFNSEDFRELAGKPTLNSTVSLSDLYGKVPRQKVTIGANNENRFNVNLKIEAQAAKPNVFAYFGGEPQETVFDFTIRGNIGSNSLETFALRTGSWHPTVGLVIRIGPVSYTNLVPVAATSATGSPSNGIVAGRGADATGCSGCCDCNDCASWSRSGGSAILIEHGSESIPTRIVNNGIIGSGGSGGHGITMNRDRKHCYHGGGGAGIPGGAQAGGGYGCGAPGSYLEGGCGSHAGGDLGSGTWARPTRPSIIFGSFKYTIEGSGVVRGTQASTMPTTGIT